MIAVIFLLVAFVSPLLAQDCGLVSSSVESSDNRIVGGQTATIEDLPWQVSYWSLKIKQAHFLWILPVPCVQHHPHPQ